MRSTQGLQSNQIQCGKVTGAASPSTLAFTKMIKVDLSPTRVHSLAKIFILLLLSLILVKSFFFICEDTRPIVSTATVVLWKTRPCLWKCLPEDQLNFQSLLKVCYFLPYNMLFWKLEQWFERVCSLCVFKFGNT